MFFYSGGKLSHLRPKTAFPYVRTLLSRFPLWVWICLGLLAVLMIGLYVLRSGNSQISGAEITLRNALTEWTGARPRTKEFLLGWPVFAAFVYLFAKKADAVWCWLFATGSSVLFASVSNTFCHVFADFTLSLSRTVNGLIFSLPICLLLILILNLILKKEKTQ